MTVVYGMVVRRRKKSRKLRGEVGPMAMVG